MNTNQNMKALFILANAGFADEVIEIARKAGARGATILNARGEGVHHEVFMGITLDSEKEMIICVLEDAISENVVKAVTEQAGIKTPAHSVCFSMSIDKVVGVGMLDLKEDK